MAERDEMIDWELAVATATRLAGSGPTVEPAQARAVVAELRSRAGDAAEHVRAYTGLEARGPAGPVAVVDRPSWIQVNADGLRGLLDPLVSRLAQRRAGMGTGAGTGVGTAVGSRVTGLEAGALLAFLAGKVLGQYELFTARGSDGAYPPGRLLLVAPNVVATEREMRVDPHDFRLWVCLHEETHRVQFTAVPWLREHLQDEISAFLDETELDPLAVLRRLRGAVDVLGDVIRGDGHTSLLDIVQTPAQREILDRLTAVMSLLEGHADVVMDGVGPGVVPSVEEIRRKFQRRREGTGRLDQALRRLLGIDAKMRQYRDGAAFVRGVVDRVGMAGFNRVWTSPDTLPTKDEIGDPARWVARVHGRPALDAGGP
jgi:coenzyme F420 biosynthesis associated uncharacterized protein